jgi:N-acetylmuramoyl-L-alanine amidase
MSRTLNITSGLLTMSVLTGALVITLSMGGQPDIDPKSQNCLAMNIYHEARGEVIEGQIAVAHVTMNRVEHKEWPNSICDVVYQPKQFSWTFMIKDQTPKENKSWKQARAIARDVMIGNVDDPTKGATFYHATYVNPVWADQMEVSKIIDKHVFYVWDGTWD